MKNSNQINFDKFNNKPYSVIRGDKLFELQSQSIKSRERLENQFFEYWITPKPKSLVSDVPEFVGPSPIPEFVGPIQIPEFEFQISKRNFRKKTEGIEGVKEKKGVHSSSSSRQVKSTLVERFSQLFGLDLISDNYRKMIFSDLKEKVGKIQNNEKLDSGIKKMRTNEIFSRYENLSKSLCRVKNSDETKEMLYLMFGTPFSVCQIVKEFYPENSRERNNLKGRIYNIADNLVKYDIFKTINIKDPKWKLPPTTMRDGRIYFYPRYHSTEDIQIYVIDRFYKHLAKIYPKVRLSPQEKAEQKAIQKAYNQAKQTQLDISPFGDALHTAIATNKKRKKLKEKAIELQVLRTPKENQVKLVKEKIELAKLETTKFKELTTPSEPIQIEEPKNVEISSKIIPGLIPKLVLDYPTTEKLIDSMLGGFNDFINLKILLPTLKARGYNMKIVNQVIQDRLASGKYRQPKANVLCRNED